MTLPKSGEMDNKQAPTVSGADGSWEEEWGRVRGWREGAAGKEMGHATWRGASRKTSGRGH